jgi:WD40-like Beta Propeller Repeat
MFLRVAISAALTAVALAGATRIKPRVTTPPNASAFLPELFAPGIISTDLDELCGSFTPDGKFFYFVRRGAYTTSPSISIICFTELRKGNWSHPEVAPFSGTYLDGSPYLSSDGKRLLFSSKRPTKANPNGRDWNIWFVEKIDNRWAEPQEIGEPINTAKNDTNPAIAADGTLYFASDRDAQPGHYHLYRSRLMKGKYEQPEKLGLEINSGDAEINPYIRPDQKFLIFASYRKDNLDSGGNQPEDVARRKTSHLHERARDGNREAREALDDDGVRTKVPFHLERPRKYLLGTN